MAKKKLQPRQLAGQAAPQTFKFYPARSARTAVIGDLPRLVGRAVTLAGRVASVTRNGFLLRDESGSVEVNAPELPELHSIVEVHGKAYRQESGTSPEIFFQAENGRELALAEREPRTDKQWEHCIIDPALREMVYLRSALLNQIRRFFISKGFVEVDTPSLVAAPGMEPYLESLETKIYRSDSARASGYLITSPEYAMKKLLVAGFEKLFEISKCYRNHEMCAGLHNVEFSMLEWYRAYASYLEIMDDCETLVKHLAKSVLGKEILRVNGSEIRISEPWERMTVSEAFQKYAGIDLAEHLDTESLRTKLWEKGYRPVTGERYEDLFFRIFLNEIEPCLGIGQPTILYDYPVQLGALAKRKADDPRFVERFELFIAGRELANAFTELNDPNEQVARFRQEQQLRKKLGKTVFEADKDFISALKTGMPPAGGIALGLDRLMMTLLGKERIEDVLLFPAKELFSFKKEQGPVAGTSRKKRKTRRQPALIKKVKRIVKKKPIKSVKKKKTKKASPAPKFLSSKRRSPALRDKRVVSLPRGSKRTLRGKPVRKKSKRKRK